MNLKLAVIVPTWKRLKKLQACLQSLESQFTSPDLVIITYREEDKESADFLAAWQSRTPLNTRLIKVERPGVIHAENEAIRHARTLDDIEIVTFMDDDAISLPQSIAHIKDFFSTRPDAAALGGPDLVLPIPWSYDIHVDVVGKVSSYGRVTGNHHHRSTGLREVDVLKGVNMSVRKSFLTTLDSRLQGTDPAKGNGVFWELDLCMKIKARGGKLYFDPELLIHHDSNHDHFIHAAAVASTSHNLTVVLMTHFPWNRRILYLLHAFFIGHGNVRGLVKTAYDCFRTRSFLPLRDFGPSMKGFFSGLKTWSQSS